MIDWNTLPDENSFRFVAVLNKKIGTGELMNALGHMTAGLSGLVGNPKEMYFLRYVDKDGGTHPGVSHFPFIVLAADNSNQIRTVRKEVIKRGLPFTDFTSTMAVGTSQEQMKATAGASGSELEYYGIVLFGKTNVIKEFTKKLSLFR